MKRILSFALIFVMLFGMLISCKNVTAVPDATTSGETTEATTGATTSEKSKSDKLYVGFGRSNITPRDTKGELIPTPLSGNNRIAKDIITDIFTSCTAIRDEEGDTILFFTVDALNIPTEIVGEIQNEVRKATGVGLRNIFITASHAHSTPQLGNSGDFYIKKYKQNVLYPAFAEAGKSAMEDIALCTELYAGELDGTGLNFIRRYITDNQGRMQHEIEGDHSMPVIRFVREGDKKDVILANWAAHCDTVSSYNKYAISGDYYFYCTEKVEQTLNAHLSIYNAASGDVNPFSKIEGETVYGNTRVYGTALAELLIKNINVMPKLDIVSDVEVLYKTIKLTVDHTKDDLLEQAKEIRNEYNANGSTKKYKDLCSNYGITDIHEADAIYTKAALEATDSMNVYAISIGNIVFGTAPYEILSKTGMDIKESSKFDLTFVLGYTNGRKGYIPPEYAFDNGNYEVYVCRYVKGTAEQIQSEISALIDKLYTDIYEK